MARQIGVRYKEVARPAPTDLTAPVRGMRRPVASASQ